MVEKIPTRYVCPCSPFPSRFYLYGNSCLRSGRATIRPCAQSTLKVLRQLNPMRCHSHTVESSPMDAISLYSASVGSARRMALAPRLRASIASVSLSPITYESARLYPPEVYSPSNAVPGLRVGAFSSGKVRSMIIYQTSPLGGKSAEHLVVG